MPDTLRDLERSLANEPANRTLLAALADLMIEHHDPRGEYLRLCIAAEQGHANALAPQAFWKLHEKAMWGPLQNLAEALIPIENYYCWPRSLQTSIVSSEFLEAAALCPLLSRLVVCPENPVDVGDAGVERLLSSSLLAQIRVLEMPNCAITDDGALLLSQILPVFQVKTLRLSGNHLTAIGLFALESAGYSDLGPQSRDSFGLVPYV